MKNPGPLREPGFREKPAPAATGTVEHTAAAHREKRHGPPRALSIGRGPPGLRAFWRARRARRKEGDGKE